MKYIQTDRKTMVEQFVQVKNNPQVRLICGNINNY